MIWHASNGKTMPDDMRFEAFLNSQINYDNQARRANRRRSGIPELNDGVFTIVVAILH